MPSPADAVALAKRASSRPAEVTELDDAPREAGLRLALLLVVAGAVGLAAAFVLLVEKIALIEDPSYVPTCSISPILSCGSIMGTAQAEVFGFPNPIIGVMGFSAITTIGAAILAGASFRRWFWLGLQAGVTFGVVFVHWLIFESLYRIGALCPYCMVVWVVTIALAWYVTLHNLTRGHLGAPRQLRPLVELASDYHGVVLTTWYLVIAGLIAQRFWDYWRTLAP